MVKRPAFGYPSCSMARVPQWLIAMFVGVVAAGAAGGAGAHVLVALLAALVVGVVSLRVLRDPPWSGRGRAAWRRSAERWSRSLTTLLSSRRAVRGWSTGVPTGSHVPPVEAGDARPPDARPGSRIPVRCEIATERIQVWHSTTTQRAYEVTAERGLAGARPGSMGDLIFERGRPRVVARELN